MSVRAATEAEWADCQEPERLIKVVQAQGSQRKLRLVLAAAARLVWDQLPPGEMREAVEACEGRAEGAIGQERIDEYRHRFYEYVDRHALSQQRQWEENPALRSVFSLVLATTYPDSTLRVLADNPFWRRGTEPHGKQVSDIIRDVFGNPYRLTSFSPDWRTGTALTIARGMYESRDFSAMPILADALQDAGCDNAAVLDHCRGPGQPGGGFPQTPSCHVRGCWVVDLLLGKS